MSEHPYKRPCHGGPCTDKGIADPGFCQCAADRARAAELEEALEDMIEDAERQMKNPSHHMPFSMNKARTVLAKRRET